MPPAKWESSYPGFTVPPPVSFWSYPEWYQDCPLHHSYLHVCEATIWIEIFNGQLQECIRNGSPNSKVYGAKMGPAWGWQDPGGPHNGPMNFAIWAIANPWITFFLVNPCTHNLQSRTHTHTHTYIYIYILIPIRVKWYWNIRSNIENRLKFIAGQNFNE